MRFCVHSALDATSNFLGNHQLGGFGGSKNHLHVLNAKINLSARQNWLPICRRFLKIRTTTEDSISTDFFYCTSRLECKAHGSTSLLQPERRLGLSATSNVVLSCTKMGTPNKSRMDYFLHS